MQVADLRNNISPSSLRGSLRNRPTRLLYQPPARRCADNQLKSSSLTFPKSPTVTSETHSQDFYFPEMTESKRGILCESKDAKEPQELASSRISHSSSSSQEDLDRASYTRLKPTDQCSSGRTRGLGRGKLLKLQLLYESRYVKADKMNDAASAAHIQNLDNAGPLLSADLNHNNNNNNPIREPFLGISSSESQSLKFQDATPPENDFGSFTYDNKVSRRNGQYRENSLSPPIGGPDIVQYVSKEVECRMGDHLQNMTQSFGSGDWEPKAKLDSDPSSFSRQKSLRAQNDYSSQPDHNSNLIFSNDDSKDMSKIFYINNKTEDEESVDVFYSQTSSLSDETYLTVSSQVSDLDRSTDGCDQESVLSESISWTECLSQDSSADAISLSTTKTSFNDSQDEKSSESSLSFQEETKEEVINTVDCRDRISHDVDNRQAGDNQNWSINRMEKEFNARQPKLSPRSNKCQKSISSETGSDYSSVRLPNSNQRNSVSFCPSTSNYRSPTSYSPQPLMTNSITFENSSSPYRSSRPPNSNTLYFPQFYNKENIPNELGKDVSCEWGTRTERSPWSGGRKGGDCFVDTFRSRFKEISFTNQNRWKDSTPQYRKVIGTEFSQEWKERYKRKCSEAGHKFLDTHCHIDMMFNEHLDRIYGTFQEYREAHADSFPEQFGGCVAIFCNPLTFNPRGSLFRSLLNENHVWVAVGCHPKKVKFLNNRTLQHLDECIRMPQVVAVGEIGLDYSGMFHLEADIQKRVFRAQIKMALDVSKPIVIHCRDAEDDCFNILREECPLDWLIHLHCYMLDFEHAKRWLDTFPNLYIGLTPKVTFRNSADVQDTASKIPLNRLVLESDAPYFIPSMVPYNQLKCSHPGLVFTVAEKVARLQVRDVREVLKACWDNSHRLYRINPAS